MVEARDYVLSGKIRERDSDCPGERLGFAYIVKYREIDPPGGLNILASLLQGGLTWDRQHTSKLCLLRSVSKSFHYPPFYGQEAKKQMLLSLCTT